MPAAPDRVSVIPQMRLTPVVRLLREEAPPPPPGVPSVAADADFERRLLSEAQQASTAEQSTANLALHNLVQGFADEADRLVAPGVSPEDARLASALAGEGQAPKFAENLAALRPLGFSAAVCAGALLQTNNDLERASDRLLTG